MLGRASFAALIGFTLFTLAACSSVPELRFEELDGGVVLPEGGVVPDGGVDPNCKPTGAEICDDGIDNDCDGRTDCQDSQCTAGFSCQDAPPGWTAVGFTGTTTTPACPANTTSSDLKVAAGDGSASCSCSCTSVGGSCAGGNFTVNVSSEATCVGAGSATGSVPKSGNCQPLAAPFGVPTNARIAPITGPSSCTPNPTVNGTLTNGRMCQAARFGAGCGTDQVCAPKPATGFASCVTKTAKSVCPTGFTKRSTAGATATDMRTCTGCVCPGPTACSGGSVSLYDNSMCKTAGSNDGAEGITFACAGVTPDSAFTATHYTATAPTGGCGSPTTQATAGGTLSLAGDRTVCCK